MRAFHRKHLFSALIVGFICLAMAPDILAQTIDSFSDSINEFQGVDSQAWRSQALMVGRYIFFTLATIDIAFMSIAISLNWIEKPPMEVLIWKAVLLGLFFSVLYFFDAFDGIIRGFMQLAQVITNVDTDVNETKIFLQGWDFLFNTVLESFKDISVWEFITGRGMKVFFRFWLTAFSGLAVFFGFAIIALQYAFITIEVVLTLTFGPIFLGFLPLKPTRVYGEQYLSYLFHLGIKLFIFYVVFAFAYSVLTELIQNMSVQSNADLSQSWELAFMAVLSVFLLAKLPGKIADKVTANTQFSLESLLLYNPNS